MQNEKVRVEIDAQTLERMIDSGYLSASDMRCLDCDSKQCIWKMCLSICADKLNIPAECAVCPKQDKKQISRNPLHSQEEAISQSVPDEDILPVPLFI